MAGKNSSTNDGQEAVPNPAAMMAEHPVLREVTARHESLKAELDRANAAVRELLARGAASARKSRAEELAEAVAASGKVSAADEVPKSDEMYRRDLTAATNRRCMLMRAVEICEEELTHKRYAVAAQVAEKLRPHYTEIVAAIARKVAELGPLIEREVEFRSWVHDAGIPQEYIGAHQLLRLGVPRDQHGFIRAWLQGAVERGHIRESDIPAEWRRIWNAPQDRYGRLVLDD